jgi:hypothetical protein
MRRTILAAVLTAAALTLSACMPPIPELPAAQAPAEAAAVVESQSDRIVAETSAELAAADAALDAKLLVDRVGGDAKIVRAAEYKQQKADKTLVPDVIPSTTQAVYTSAADTWPLELEAVTEQPAEDITRVVQRWVQDSVEDNYQMRAWTHMVPGATLPAMASTATGAAQLALDDPSMSPTPGAVLSDYIKLLQEGGASPLNAEFAPDPYREQLFTARTVLTKAAKKAKGTYKDTITNDEERTYVLQTAEGGALVFSPVSVVSTFTVKGAKVSIPAADKALLTGGKLTTKVVHTYNDMVVLYIPGPSVTDKPGLVATDHNLVKVSPK